MVTGLSYRDLGFTFRIGASTISDIIEETLSAIWINLYKKHMPVPTKHHFLKVAKGFYDKFGFPHCLGALDGKHMRIKCPSHSASLYYNWKKFYSIILQAVVDSDNKFIAIDVGGYGSQHDSSTFQASSLYRTMQSNRLEIPDPMCLPNSDVKVPLVFIADCAYPLMLHVLKPFRRPVIRNLSNDEKNFNKKLSQARRVVEYTFGQLTKKFSIFNKRIEQSPQLVKKIVQSSCLLHNIIIDFNMANDELQQSPEVPVEACGMVNFEEQNKEIEYGAKETKNKFVQYFKN